MNETSQELLERFVQDHGDKRVIAANYLIWLLINEILESERNERV